MEAAHIWPTNAGKLLTGVSKEYEGIQSVYNPCILYGWLSKL